MIEIAKVRVPRVIRFAGLEEDFLQEVWVQGLSHPDWEIERVCMESVRGILGRVGYRKNDLFMREVPISSEILASRPSRDSEPGRPVSYEEAASDLARDLSGHLLVAFDYLVHKKPTGLKKQALNKAIQDLRAKLKLERA
jgi:hypothetical protein